MRECCPVTPGQRGPKSLNSSDAPNCENKNLIKRKKIENNGKYESREKGNKEIRTVEIGSKK